MIYSNFSKNLIGLSVVCCLVLSITVSKALAENAESVTQRHSNPHHIRSKLITKSIRANNGRALHDVSILRVDVSTAARQLLRTKMRSAVVEGQTISAMADQLPSSVDLGMGGVPVFDQGMHGTCVTFALTAAIDASLKKGDYISQTCSLVLGNSLEKQFFDSDGWMGSNVASVFNRFNLFGIVNVAQQKAGICAGVTSYPPTIDSPERLREMPISDYMKVSESIGSTIYMVTIQDERGLWDEIPRPSESDVVKNQKRTLSDTKKALINGERIVITAMLPYEIGQFGAAGMHKSPNDSYVVTSAMMESELAMGVHEMVIYGYDDQAYVTDDQGKRHKGVFKVRNSFGSDVGDKGDFYMTYAFFKSYILGAYRIGAHAEYTDATSN